MLIFQFLNDKIHNYVFFDIIVNFIIQKLKNRHTFLKKPQKVAKLSKAKSCDSRFRIFILTQKFWAIEILAYSCAEAINWRENKKFGTICFELRIPIKKPYIFGIFLRNFLKQNIIFGFKIFNLEENKNIFWNIFIPSKCKWAIAQMSPDII